MLKPPPIGDQELALLQFMTDRGRPMTVREAAQEWRDPSGKAKARTTILTMMERLREKNLLVREKGQDDATFQYRPAVEKSVLLRGLVQEFVSKALGGSVSPFVAYLADAGPLSSGEIAALRRLVDSFEEEEEGGEFPDAAEEVSD